MTIEENIRFTVYQMVSDYTSNKHENLWNIAKAVKTAYNIGAVSKGETEMLCNNLHLTFEEMMSA